MKHELLKIYILEPDEVKRRNQMKLNTILEHPFATILIIGAIGTTISNIILASKGAKLEPFFNVKFDKN